MLDLDRAARLLALCPAHAPTPLHRHGPLWLKDETGRMGLGAFKALGGVHAACLLLARARGVTPEALHGTAGPEVLVCASAGNHGIAVATGARLFGARARIHIAGTVPEAFAARLRAAGAEVIRSGRRYEDAMTAAARDDGILLPDGDAHADALAPRLVMEGYTQIARELAAQMPSVPERVYLQAGVGGLAAAMAEGMAALWPAMPEVVVVEPEAAPCLRDGVAAGRIVTVDGPVSAMGRLDCKAASALPLAILARRADRFETVSDAEAQAAADHAATLGRPTTPSGAAGLACALRDGGAGLCILSEGPE